jgi:hypothetical protein
MLLADANRGWLSVQPPAVESLVRALNRPPALFLP